MPDFRCKMLDERGGTLFFEDIVADNLEGAILHSSNVLHAQPVLVVAACIRIRSLVQHEPALSFAVVSPEGPPLLVSPDDQIDGGWRMRKHWRRWGNRCRAMAHRRDGDNDAMGAGMLRAWVMLWHMGLTGLLAVVALGLGVVAFMHVVTSIRNDAR